MAHTALINAVQRALAEQCSFGYFFLITGAKGAGKSHAVDTTINKLCSSEGTRNVTTNSLVDMMAPKAEGGAAGARVCRLDYDLLVREGERVLTLGTRFAANEQVFLPHSVLVVDDLDALWTLCSLNAEVSVLKRLLRRILASPQCVLLATARSENSVPTTLLEWRQPLVYPVSALSFERAQEIVTSHFAANDSRCLGEDLSASKGSSALASATPQSLLMALCVSREAEAVAMRELCEAPKHEDVPRSAMLLQCLSSLSPNRKTDGETVMGNSPPPTQSLSPLWGLEDIHARTKMLISVFAASRSDSAGGAEGGVAAHMRGTTGILLHGPSGCGKTSLARRLALDFPTMAFFVVKCTSLFSKYLGESEEKLRQVYRRARARAPAVVVLDDVDVIAQSRGSMSNSTEDSSRGGVNVNKRMLAGLLCELDGVTDNSGVLTIGTTNTPEVLDSALLRQGRLETLLYVPPLSMSAATEMSRRFFAAFDGGEEEKDTLAASVARHATGCAAASLSFVLRRILENAIAKRREGATQSAEPTNSAATDLPLPAASDVAGILFETTPMMLRTSYTFDTRGTA